MSFTTPNPFTGEPPKAVVVNTPSLGSLTVAKPDSKETIALATAEAEHPFLYKTMMLVALIAMLLFVFCTKNISYTRSIQNSFFKELQQ